MNAIPLGPPPMPDAAATWLIRTLGRELVSDVWAGMGWSCFYAGCAVASLAWLAAIVLALALRRAS